MDTELKQCVKCKEHKERDLFHNKKSAKDGKHSYCKSCNAAQTRSWQKANPEKEAAKSRAYHKANTEKVAERKRAYHKENREKRLAYQSAYRKENREKVAAASCAYHKENREKVAAKVRFNKYKLSPGDINKKLKEQDNKCSICKKDISSEFCVDHSHQCCPGLKSCGKCVRGLLCHKCNSLCGMANDRAEILQEAINYLDKWNQIQYTNKSNSESEDICNSQN